MSDALVLGGGGVAGVAWTTGLLAGLADTGQEPTGADLIIGTSAGSVVGAQLGGGLSLEELHARQADPRRQASEVASAADAASLGSRVASVLGNVAPAEARAAVGRWALRVDTMPEQERRSVIAACLPSHTWPARELRIVAVDAGSGEPRVFDRSSGVDLVDAVAASCAVPGVWPPVTVGGRRYVDGGLRSGANADLAAGSARVLLVVPLGELELLPTERSQAEVVQALRDGGADVVVVAPDGASAAAFGANPLDPSTRAPAAEAGRAQGRALQLGWSG